MMTALWPETRDTAVFLPTARGDELPPHDPAAEAGALGCVVGAVNGEAEGYFDRLALDHFYDERHRRLYIALSRLRAEGKPLDVVSLGQLLRDRHQAEEVGGFDYFSSLPDQTPSPAHFPAFQTAIEGFAARRVAIRDAVEVQRLALDTSIAPPAIADACRRMLEGNSRMGANRAKLTIRKPDELLCMQFDDSDRILGDRIMATAQSTVISGAGGLGKSRLLQQLAVATITGRNFVGFETHKPELRWLILQAENSNRRLQSDLAALKQWVGTDAWARVNEQLAIHTLESDADGFLSLGDPSAQRRIADAISDTSPDVVCFDSLYNFAIGDLNKDEDMGATLLSMSRLARAGDPARTIAVLHHALTGKAGAMRATGYDRASFGRNSKVLHSWTRAQINIAPGSPESNDLLVVTCGKLSNGKEFAPRAIRLNPDTMIYEPAPDFDLVAWESDLNGKKEGPLMTPDRVKELCGLPLTKAELSHAIREDCGCARQVSYRYIKTAEKRGRIRWNPKAEHFIAK